MATDNIDTNNNSTPISADQSVDTRDFRIGEITLIGSDGVAHEISPLVAELQIRQDIYLGFMSGEMLITDGVDMHSQIAFHGEEYVYIDIREPEQELAIKKAFRVYKVSTRTPIQNNYQRYIVYFVSDELVSSSTSKVSKAYKGSKVSSIALDILQNYLHVPDTQILYDETSVPVDLIVPNLRPHDALNWLAYRAYTSDDPCFLFYENLHGFNFRSLSSIYKQGTVIKVPFVFENKSGMKAMDMDKYAIDSWEGKVDFDVLNQVNSGGYAMSLLGLDPFHQSFTTQNYPLDKTGKKLFANPPMTNTKDEDGVFLFDRGSTHFLTYLDTEATSTEKASGTREWVKGVMSLAALQHSMMELVIPGSIRIEIGTLVSLRFPYATTPSDGSSIWDKRKSGRYLIVAVNHKFDLLNHRFDTIFMVARDSVPEPYTSDPDIQSKIKKMNRQTK